MDEENDECEEWRKRNDVMSSKDDTRERVSMYVWGGGARWDCYL